MIVVCVFVFRFVVSGAECDDVSADVFDAVRSVVCVCVVVCCWCV